MPLRLLIALGLAALLVAVLGTWSTRGGPQPAGRSSKPVGTGTLSHGPVPAPPPAGAWQDASTPTRGRDGAD